MKIPRRRAHATWTACLAGATCAAQALPLRVQVSDQAGAPLPGAVVAVEVGGVPRTAPQARAQMGQRALRFVPAVLVVQTGTAVSFPNFDTIRHHVYSFSPVKPFELELYTGTPDKPVVFDRPGVAALGCNIHDSMSAWVVVVDTPHFAQTDAQGHAALDLPAGEHVLRAWHPRLGEVVPRSQALRVPATPPVQLRLRLPTL